MKFTKNDGTYTRLCAVCGAVIRPFHIEMMTGHEYNCYVLAPNKVPAEHKGQFQREQQRVILSQRAKKARDTKRRKYTSWPTRARIHRIR